MDRTLKALIYLKLLRPSQWLKNSMLFFPPFLAGEIFSSPAMANGVVAFIAFCLASSSTYVVNDILDRESDALHPEKKHRPLSSGLISVADGWVIFSLLLISALVVGSIVSITLCMLLLAYLAISLAYSWKLKEIPIIDLFCVTAGFLIRLKAGGEVFDISISEWLFLSVFLLSLFLSTGKRLGEKVFLGKKAVLHRRSLSLYPRGMLDGILYMTGAAVLVTYTLYVITRHALVYTVILCCFGLLRFIYRIKSGLGGDPTDSLLKDGPLFVVGVLWVVMVGWIIYG